MCGIFGLITEPEKAYQSKAIWKSFENIAVFSESRGKDSSGMAIRKTGAGKIDLIKGDIPIRSLLQSKSYKHVIGESLTGASKGGGFCAFGHARLVTNGTQLNEVNNQPVLKDDLIIIHNGIIVNIDELWEQHPDLKREYNIDTEIIPALIRKNLNYGKDLLSSLNLSLTELEGTYSIACMFQDLDQFVLATNNGSLYYLSDNETYIIFASEGYFLEKLKKEHSFKVFGKDIPVRQILPDKGLFIGLDECIITEFNVTDFETEIPVKKREKILGISKSIIENKNAKYEVVIDPAVYINRNKEQHLFELLGNNIESIQKLRRCSKCLLPETFPFIEYDDKEVCNYCNNYTIKNQSVVPHLRALYCIHRGFSFWPCSSA